MLKNLQKLLTFTVNACTRFNVVLAFIIMCKSSCPSHFFGKTVHYDFTMDWKNSVFFLLRLNISKQNVFGLISTCNLKKMHETSKNKIKTI